MSSESQTFFHFFSAQIFFSNHLISSHSRVSRLMHVFLFEEQFVLISGFYAIITEKFSAILTMDLMY